MIERTYTPLPKRMIELSAKDLKRKLVQYFISVGDDIDLEYLQDIIISHNKEFTLMFAHRYNVEVDAIQGVGLKTELSMRLMDVYEQMASNPVTIRKAGANLTWSLDYFTVESIFQIRILTNGDRRDSVILQVAASPTIPYEGNYDVFYHVFVTAYADTLKKFQQRKPTKRSRKSK